MPVKSRPVFMTWISFGFGFAVVDSLFPSVSKHSWIDWDQIKKILPPSSQNCVKDLWIKGGFQNVIAEGFQHIVKSKHVLRSHQVVHFSLCCWWGLQSVTFIHLIHQNTNDQKRRNTETRQRRRASANCRMVRAAAGYQIQSHTHSLLTLLTLLSLITLVTMHTAFFLGNIDKFGHLTSVSDLTIPRLRHHRLPITIQSCPKYFHRGEIEIVAFLYFR